MKDKVLIGGVYNLTNDENKLAIWKDKLKQINDENETNCPFVLFFSDEKVYYLNLIILTNNNRDEIEDNEDNLIFETDLYGEQKEIAINCSAIYVMSQKLFENLYVEDKEDICQISPYVYDKVMKTLHKNEGKIKYFEIDDSQFEDQ
ncbi:Mbov_0400 family ICE element protein [Metamycoplasma alkalescens]|uniref:Mbov_0400 family ICE element protein n=1 Tax=Metamycoplasma alkalescens TaxID=45363 RepID=UPI003CFDAC11